MTTLKKVRAGSTYRFDPVPLDLCDPPAGVRSGILEPGDIVRVVNLPGCPKANTMGMCHVKTLEGQFAGLVCVGSLKRA